MKIKEILKGIIISIITGNFENLGNVLLSSTNDAFNIFFKIYFKCINLRCFL